MPEKSLRWIDVYDAGENENVGSARISVMRCETISIDLFSEIYEYFLGNFALGEEAPRLEREILGDSKRIFK